MRRVTQRRLAHHLDCTPKWVNQVLNGYVPAPASFRSGTAELLGMPEHDLFLDDELAEDFRPVGAA